MIGASHTGAPCWGRGGRSASAGGQWLGGGSSPLCPGLHRLQGTRQGWGSRSAASGLEREIHGHNPTGISIWARSTCGTPQRHRAGGGRIVGGWRRTPPAIQARQPRGRGRSRIGGLATGTGPSHAIRARHRRGQSTCICSIGTTLTRHRHGISAVCSSVDSPRGTGVLIGASQCHCRGICAGRGRIPPAIQCHRGISGDVYEVRKVIGLAFAGIVEVVGVVVVVVVVVVAITGS